MGELKLSDFACFSEDTYKPLLCVFSVLTKKSEAVQIPYWILGRNHMNMMHCALSCFCVHAYLGHHHIFTVGNAK